MKPHYKYAVNVTLQDKSATTVTIRATCQTIALRKAADKILKEYGRDDVRTMRIDKDPVPYAKKERRRQQEAQAREHRERHTATYIGLTRID